MREWTLQDVTIPMPIPPTEGPWIALYVVSIAYILGGLWCRFPFGPIGWIPDEGDSEGSGPLVFLLSPFLLIGTFLITPFGITAWLMTFGHVPPPWRWGK